MAKIIRVIEHNGNLFREGDYVKVTLVDESQFIGKIRIPTVDSLVIGPYSLSSEIGQIKGMKKIN